MDAFSFILAATPLPLTGFVEFSFTDWSTSTTGMSRLTTPWPSGDSSSVAVPFVTRIFLMASPPP